MSRKRSDSNHSSSSSNTTTSANNHENSNVLYNDHEHYEVIFKNDSRFFDTSLHLFKSYRKRGYLPPKTKKRGKSPLLSVPPVLKKISSRASPNSGSLGKSKLIGFNSNHNVSILPNNTTIKTTDFQRNQATSMSLRSDPGIQKLVNRSSQQPQPRHFPSSLPVPPYSPQYRHNGHLNHNDDDDDSDDSNIIVTRL